MLTPAIYRTTISHSRRTPVQHSFEYRSYSWYVDVDELPRLPRWLRLFARFDADDHFAGPRHASLRERLSAFFAERGLAVPDGRITALLQARVLGYVFNPLSVFWCHDREGAVRHVVAEVHNTYGERHAYLLPPADQPVATAKQFYVSPFFAVDGYYLVRAPRPDNEVHVTVALHLGHDGGDPLRPATPRLRSPRGRRDGGDPLRRPAFPEFIATLHGSRRPATPAQVAIMQIVSPLAPLVVSTRIRMQGIKLWLRRVPVVPR
ncbi:MAG: DUF1365 family protein [Mycobacterium sp.]|uniref:DUF1365 domain-containing protein n=1 Tax=Mycobacterium sp. TaxID=1785 RepID=UPI001ECF1927|nr:DUF1365 family protein [Mycobacterium sp.]MBW0019757.1 DUF1365 family protein [Mycobacterium sp.]